MMINTHEKELKNTHTLNHACGEIIGMFCPVFFIIVLERLLFSCLFVTSTFCTLFCHIQIRYQLQIALPVKEKDLL